MRKQFFTYFLFLLIGTYFNVSAQTVQIDSLLQALETTEPNRNKVHLYTQLGRAFQEVDTTKALQYLETGLDLANTLEYHAGAGELLTQKALIFTRYENYSEANQYYKQAVNQYKFIDDNNRIIQIYRRMSTNMRQINHHSEALQYQLDAYLYAQVLNDKRLLVSTSRSIANIYGTVQDYTKALEFQKIAYEHCKSVCSSSDLATGLNNLGSSYKDLKMYDKAIEALHKSLIINDSLDIANGLIYNYATLSEVHQKQGQIDSSYYYADLSLKLSIEKGGEFDILYGYNDLGRVLIGQGKYQEAIKYLEKAYEGSKIGARNSFTYAEIVGLATQNLYIAYEGSGNYKKAYAYLKEYTSRQEKVTEDYVKKSDQIQKYYDDEQKQTQIDLLNKANALKEAELRTTKLIEYSAFVAGIIALVFVFFLYRNVRKNQQANVLLQSKNKAIQKRNREIADQKEQMEQAFNNVKLLSQIGQEVTSSLSVERIIKTAYTNVNSLMKAEGFGIGLYNSSEKRIEFPGFIEKGVALPMSFDLLSNQQQLSVWSFQNQKEVVINNMVEDYGKYSGQKNDKYTIPNMGEMPESILYVPLNTKDRKIGVVTVQSFEKNAYQDYHLDILRNLAIYIAIALENADNFKKIEKSSHELEQQKELIEEKNLTLAQQNEKIEQSYENIKLLGNIGQDIISELSIEKIVATVYQNVNELMEASVFWIGIWNKEENCIEFEGAIESGNILEPFSMPAQDKNRLASWCLLNDAEIFINDYLRDYGKFISIIQPAVAGEQSASIIYLPLRSKDGVLGVITVQSFRKYAYTDYHLNILRNLATYTSIALDNALLYQNLEGKVEERTAEIEAQKAEIEQAFKNIKLLSEIGQVITGMLSMDQIIEAIYNNVNDLMDATAFGVGIYDEDINKIIFRGAMEEGEELPIFTHEMNDRKSFSAWCLKNKKEIISNQATNDYKQYVPDMAWPKDGKNPESIMYLPLTVKKKSIGVITVQSYQGNAYTDYHENILRNLATYAAIALENAAAYLQIEKQNEEINKTSQKLRSSINYAKRIQNAILPHRSTIEGAFDDAFILFKPRDVVSGDFFWFADKGDQQFIAAVDCTGHGVPGAFMSMIGNDMLDEIINVLDISSVDIILNEMHKRVRKALKQKETDNRDGMDMSICMIDKKRGVLEFAGAKNPLVYIDYNEKGEPELHTIKGDKMPIGGMQREVERIFSKHTVQLYCSAPVLADGDDDDKPLGEPILRPITFYMFSDGYQDQFGGRNGRKFMFKNFKNLLFKIHAQPMSAQRETLKEIVNMWMEDEHQTDDILVLGFRV